MRVLIVDKDTVGAFGTALLGASGASVRTGAKGGIYVTSGQSKVGGEGEIELPVKWQLAIEAKTGQKCTHARVQFNGTVNVLPSTVKTPKAASDKPAKGISMAEFMAETEEL